jgi:hypothetical protein
MRRFVGVAVAVACFVIVQKTVAAEPGVCLSSTLGVEGAKPGDCFAAGETETLLDRGVLSSDGEQVFHTMTNGVETRSVKTCREYISLSSQDTWSPPGERFDTICNAVMMLSGAQPATQSYLRPGDADLKDTQRLTVLVIPPMGDLDPMASPNMTSVADVVATGEVTVGNDPNFALSLSYKEHSVFFRELARGDVDNDGVEDMLVERVTVNAARERSVNPLLLTRVEKDGLLVLNAQFGD